MRRYNITDLTPYATALFAAGFVELLAKRLNLQRISSDTGREMEARALFGKTLTDSVDWIAEEINGRLGNRNRDIIERAMLKNAFGAMENGARNARQSSNLQTLNIESLSSDDIILGSIRFKDEVIVPAMQRIFHYTARSQPDPVPPHTPTDRGGPTSGLRGTRRSTAHLTVYEGDKGKPRAVMA